MIHVGKIVAAHGIRGEVKVVPYTDNPRRFRKGGKVFVDNINDYTLFRVVYWGTLSF